MSNNFNNKNETNDFGDILESSDYNDYFKFCTLFGPLYAKSFSFFMLTNFLFISLCFISKLFTIFIVLNFMSWHNNMHMDWDEEHGQLDDNWADITDQELDTHTYRPIIDPFVMFFYTKSGFIVNDFKQLTTYSYILSFYENKKFYDDSFKIVDYINNDNLFIYLSENKKLIYKKNLELKHIIKKNDKNNIMYYKFKNNIIFKNDIILDLFKINNNISDLIKKSYHIKKLDKKGLYIFFLPNNFDKCFNVLNTFLKESYK
jgi:hypothetical protein